MFIHSRRSQERWFYTDLSWENIYIFIISYPTCAKLSSSDVGGCFLHPRANKPSRMISGEFILYPLDCVGARWNTKQTAEDVFLLHEMLNFTLNMWISAYNNKKKKPLSPWKEAAVSVVCTHVITCPHTHTHTETNPGSKKKKIRKQAL